MTAWSRTLPISKGVPQGSILAPILFSIYINNISYSVGNASVHLYTDNTVLYPGNPSLDAVLKTLQESFQEIQSFSALGQVLNTSKTKVTWFGRNNVSPTGAITASHGRELEVVNAYKYLRIWIDGTLFFTEHWPSCRPRSKPGLALCTAIHLLSPHLPSVPWSSLVWLWGHSLPISVQGSSQTFRHPLSFCYLFCHQCSIQYTSLYFGLLCKLELPSKPDIQSTGWCSSTKHPSVQGSFISIPGFRDTATLKPSSRAHRRSFAPCQAVIVKNFFGKIKDDDVDAFNHRPSPELYKRKKEKEKTCWARWGESIVFYWQEKESRSYFTGKDCCVTTLFSGQSQKRKKVL